MKRLLLLLLSLAVLAAVPRAGAQGGALSFDGTNYVEVPNFQNIAPTTDVTIEFWVYVNGLDTQSAFVLEPDDVTNRINGHVNWVDGKTYWDFGNINTEGRVSTSTSGTVGHWVYYVFVASQTGVGTPFMGLAAFDSATGAEISWGKIGMTPFVRGTGTYKLRIGGGPAYYLKGRIDEFRVWNTANAGPQIGANRNRTLVGNEPGLLLYYRFNEGSGTTAINSATATGHAYDGILVNNPERVVSTAPIVDVPEATVFGADERTSLNNDAKDPGNGLRKTDTESVLNEDFNYAMRKTHKASIVSAGTLTIDQNNDANGLFAQYNTTANTRELSLMAETLVIRSPWQLKGTKVTIHARNLRFEGTGRIITTPEELTTHPPDAIADAAGNQISAAGSGMDGLPAGDVEVHAGTYTEAVPVQPFITKGGKGQDAGKGKHGKDGSIVNGYSGSGGNPYFRYYLECYLDSDTAYYFNRPGYLVTRAKNNDGSIWLGAEPWPTDGKPALPAGIPGRGGDEGKFMATGNVPLFGNANGPGDPGARGVPDQVTNSSGQVIHSRTDVCEAGNKGYPEFSAHIYGHKSGACTQHVSEDGLNTSVAGSPATVAVPPESAGTNHPHFVTGNAYSWLAPELMRKILSDAKDDYLQNRIAAVNTRLKDYAQVIEQYKADTSAWNPAALTMEQSELSQMYDEMQILLQQIVNGQDYFGNPNGWVPMLSFEVNANIFDQEIDRSLDMVYLSKWIRARQDNAQAVFTALATARDKLAAEVADAQTKYTTANTTLAGLQGEAETLTLRVANLQQQLINKDNSLHAQAVKNTMPPDWEVGLRIAGKVGGAMCKMIPVYQPWLGEGGNAMKLASEYNEDEPWDTITGSFDLAETSLNSRITDASADQATEVTNASLNPTQLKAQGASAARIAKLQKLSAASGALSGGIKDVRAYMEKTKAPSPKMEAELEKLKSADPQYQALAKQIEDLMKDRRDFADKIIAAIEDVASNSDIITRNIQTMDGFSATIGTSAAVIDARVNAYLKDLERRAFDRLLKYHYYMAKAYEYRLVRPYTAQLNLTQLYDSISAIASSNGDITGPQREALHSVFKDIIAATTQQIITDYNSTPSTPGSSITFDLTAAEIASLNRGEKVTLNLVDRGLFLATEENIRIADLGVYSNLPNPLGIGTTGTYSSPAYVELCIEHSGLSNVKLDGQVHQFRHYNQSTRNAITWKSKYEPVPNILSPRPLIAADASLLRSLLPTLNTTEVLLYSRPSAWADLTIWRAGINGATEFGLGDSNAPITLTNVKLQVLYDRVFRAGSPLRKNVEVLVARASDNLGTNTVVDDTLSPTFIVSPSDPNGRNDAQGRFLRIYPYSTTPVSVSAQPAYGTLGFLKWTTTTGTLLGTDPTVATVPTFDRKLVAVYVSRIPDLTSALTATGFVGTPFSYQMTTTSTPFNFDATGLPTGLSVNPANGLISGTPTINGSFNVSLSAGNANGLAAATLVLTVSPALNDNFSNAQTLSGASGMVTGGNGGTTRETGEPNIEYPEGRGANSVWYRWTAPTTGTATIDTFGSNFDTLLGIYTGSAVNSLTLITSNDDAAPALYQSEVTFNAVAGTTYRIAVDGYQGATGSITLHYSVVNALTALETWRQIYFGSSANTGNGADTFDFDKDGIVNLAEFGFGLNPTQNNGHGQLPRPQRVGGNFVTTFTQPSGVSGITYGAEWSFTLATGSWTAIPDTGAGSTHTFSLPIGTATKLFIRLKVTNP